MLIRRQEAAATVPEPAPVDTTVLDAEAIDIEELTSLSSALDTQLALQLLGGDRADDADADIDDDPFDYGLPPSFPLLIDPFVARVALTYRLIPPAVRYSDIRSDCWHAAGRLAHCAPEHAGAAIDLLLDMGAMDEDGELHPQLVALLDAKGKRSAASSGRGKDEEEEEESGDGGDQDEDVEDS